MSLFEIGTINITLCEKDNGKFVAFCNLLDKPIEAGTKRQVIVKVANALKRITNEKIREVFG